MSEFVKRVSQKITKLSKEQMSLLLQKTMHENEDFYSIIDSLSIGLLILDKDFILTKYNTIVKSLLTFKISLDETKALNSPIWDLIDNSEIADYLKKINDNNITNRVEEFSIDTEGGFVRFISITILSLVHKGEL